jgi:hypothetical protein
VKCAGAMQGESGRGEGYQNYMKALTHIAKVNNDQTTFAAKLGLDVRGCTLSVAAARIEDAVDQGFNGVTDLESPTHKQVEFAAKFGYEISGLSRREGDAVVDDLMTQLNRETIEDEGLAPGVVVSNIHDSLGRHYVISSIYPHGIVFFRGGNGKRAWARSLRRATDDA